VMLMLDSNEAQCIKKTKKYVFKAILKTSLKHVIMRLMSSWQRLRGSGVGPESGLLDPRACRQRGNI